MINIQEFIAIPIKHTEGESKGEAEALFYVDSINFTDSCGEGVLESIKCGCANVIRPNHYCRISLDNDSHCIQGREVTRICSAYPHVQCQDI